MSNRNVETKIVLTETDLTVAVRGRDVSKFVIEEFMEALED